MKYNSKCGAGIENLDLSELMGRTLKMEAIGRFMDTSVILMQ
jgi:hypothetical protein